MKNTTLSSLLVLALGSNAIAGSAKDSYITVPSVTTGGDADAFADMRRPMTNATLFDHALPSTKLHFIFMNHQFPDKLNLSNGGQADFGGDLQLYALQFEYAFNERFSLVALKDGYVDFNPENNFTSSQGLANIGAGLKYAFIYDPANQFVASTTLAFEMPLGDEDVFQGEGDGNVILTAQAAKLNGAWQYLGALGISAPVDGDFSTMGFVSAHVGYEVNRWFIPFVEANYFSVLNEGDGGSRFNDQLGGAVPSLAPSEGADLINFGAANSEDYATVAFGFQSRLSDTLTFGAAYEIPLTDEENNITESRLTLDISYNF